jgi:hypothetical protein
VLPEIPPPPPQPMPSPPVPAQSPPPPAVQPQAVQPQAVQPQAVQPQAVQPQAVQPQAVQPPHYQVPPPPPPPGAYAQWATARPNTADLVHRELALTRTTRIAVILFGLYSLSLLLNLQIRRSAFRAMGHHLRVAIDASNNGQPTPSFSTPSTTDPLELILGLAAAVALVFALIWQFRAASAARALGYPAARSTGWGVGCWFVPIVNLWMPYQAIRDCLAPDDPHRPLVLRWWLLWIGTQILTTAATVAALASSHVALGISFVAAMFVLGFVATARRVVAAISAAHQTAVARPREM